MLITNNDDMLIKVNEYIYIYILNGDMEIMTNSASWI